MFGIELVVPFVIFLPRMFRAIGCVIMVVFQLLIIATGNYCFFNLLTIALCVLLLDDDHWAAITPERIGRYFQLPEGLKPASKLKWALHIALAVPILALSIVPMVRLSDRELPFLDPLREVHTFTAPFALVNGYGLFANMTVVRPEIEIEGSLDGENWRPYRFRWKPGPLDARPRRVAPHQPRLDWQMWFAALRPGQPPQWFDGVLFRLLQNEPSVTKLFAENPFPDEPPKFVRAVYYEYAFTDWETREDTGNWWNRSRQGIFRGPVSLR
jgi:lipase maturation factor 1